MSSTNTKLVGLVAVQALARTEDRAVATSTRNFLRSLGAVFGVAISTAVQSKLLRSTLRGKIPASLLSGVLNGSWSITSTSSEHDQGLILDAKMKSFRIVFIILVPLMSLCFIANFFVGDRKLQGDAEPEDQQVKDR